MLRAIALALVIRSRASASASQASKRFLCAAPALVVGFLLLLDRTHQISFGGYADLPFKFRLGIIGHFYSPLSASFLVPNSGAGSSPGRHRYCATPGNHSGRICISMFRPERQAKSG